LDKMATYSIEALSLDKKDSLRNFINRSIMRNGDKSHPRELAGALL